MSSADQAAGFKVVELSTVTDETIEKTLNTWASKGYVLETMHFAMRESQRRPSMAFLIFKPAAG